MALGFFSKAKGWICPGTVGRLALAFGIMLTVSTEAVAQVSSETGAIVIGNDRGGLIRERLLRISSLRHSGTPVRIEGDFCYSSCTLYLGLEQTCVRPTTTFGFHGPSFGGRPMPAPDFEYTSQIMATYYPPAIRDWFLNEARHEIRAVARVSGAELIRHGIRACN